MSSKKIIPIYDLYKKLESDKRFEFNKLEESYTPYDAASPHRHNYFEVLYFNESGGKHEIDFNSFSIEANSIHFISPEQVHLLRRENHVTGYVLSFTKEFFNEENALTAIIESLPFFDNPSALPLVRIKDLNVQKELSDTFLKIQSE